MSDTEKRHAATIECFYHCWRVPTVGVPAHGEVQHGVAELVLGLLLQLLTQTLQGSFVLNNTNGSQAESHTGNT